MWQVILVTISAILFFGFVGINIKKFGLLDCYSAYGAKWNGQLNLWSVVTIVSALLLVPVLLEKGDGSLYQFAGFLAPVSLVLVGITPQYNTDKFQWWMHQLGAWFGVLFVLLYMIVIGKSFGWLVFFTILAGGLTIWKSTHWMLWFETAIYACIYTVLLTW